MEEQQIAIERFDKAVLYVDKLLPSLPDFSHFNISAIILDSGWKQNEIDEANKLDKFIETLLVDRFKYADEQNGRFWLELNDNDRKAKNAGGHIAYLESLADKTATDNERQRLNDEKLKYDAKNAKRIFKTYWWTFVISIIAFLISLFNLIYNLFLHKK